MTPGLPRLYKGKEYLMADRSRALYIGVTV